MKLDGYEMEISRDTTTFEFISEGVKGPIPKLVQFTDIDSNNLYNLALGDKDILTGDIDDTVI